MKRHPFGCRATHRPIPPATGTQAARHGEPYAEAADAFEDVGLGVATEERSLDDELHEWRQARRKNFRLPWRQISLMASVCFGIGSLVLPDSINRTVQWLLMALAALSLITSFSTHRKPPH
jgi:hypothetical protein